LTGWHTFEDGSGGGGDVPQSFSDEDYLGAMLGGSRSPTLNCTTDDPSDLMRDDPGTVPTFYYSPDPAAIHSTVRWVFLLHAYGFAGLFFFLAFYAFFSILNLR